MMVTDQQQTKKQPNNYKVKGKARTHRVVGMVTQKEYSKLQYLAKESDHSVSEIIRYCIHEFLLTIGEEVD